MTRGEHFAAKPGAPNAFGLVGGEANAPHLTRRPEFSKSRTLNPLAAEGVMAAGSICSFRAHSHESGSSYFPIVCFWRRVP
jgi:hypothetical protein